MGLVVDIEHWPMPAAIALATEGIRAKYTTDCGGGGFGAADKEIGCKLDGARVLAVIDAMAECDRHLADWCLFAYASPGWSSTKLTNRLIENIAYDWVFVHHELTGEFIQKRTYSKILSIIPLIAGGLALEQASGACTALFTNRLVYSPAATRAQLTEQLINHDMQEVSIDCHCSHGCQCKSTQLAKFARERARYYQKHWGRIEGHIDTIRSILIGYDRRAQQTYKKMLENKMGAN
ncbi:hypothetical protein CRN61_17835 [Vibrio vulnificus]|uniref:hypothetical protein n=1 Tax=Vibrio vulnificus TaxID=672 RepID=UPI000C9DE172|nr:hypothetical protein [Vibrio vulnificus]PNG64997.1 hypothetical protein SC81_07725 [Vibrio vulnificus]POC08130.1 hypothetical protein CRN54_16565 [Vibrio vulnificus]POC78053.1 hypothetical protein CRN61_17835 [Vibrio vulnificus]